MSFFDTQNPGIGGLDEVTDAEVLVLQQITALGDPNADRILFWDDSASSYAFLTPGTGLSISGTTLNATGGSGTIDGSGTANEIVYWVDSDTVGTLAVATYPSLTELSYVKGVTSSLQTQLNTKSPLASPTFTGVPAAPTAAAATNTTQIATTAFVQQEKIGYALQATITNANPADATTYYLNSVFSVTEGFSRIYIPKAGTVTAIYLYFTVAGTKASNEQSTVSFRLNATTDTTIVSNLKLDDVNGFNTYSNTALSIAVAAGDFYEIKWVTPTWATNPVTVRPGILVYIT